MGSSGFYPKRSMFCGLPSQPVSDMYKRVGFHGTLCVVSLTRRQLPFYPWGDLWFTVFFEENLDL